jgi:DNA-binding NarL/FixJ family response regulator
LLDSHEVVRTALRHLLEAHGFDIVGEFGTVATCVREVGALRPDIVLMETQLPDSSALAACRDIRAAWPPGRILLLTSTDDEELRVGSILAGADCYLLKDVSAGVLTRTIETLGAGSATLDTDTVQRLREKAHGAVPLAMRARNLSPQERKILPLVAEGKTNKEIGVALGLSHKTVKNHLSSVYQKLHVTRRAQVAALVARDELNGPTT